MAVLDMRSQFSEENEKQAEEKEEVKEEIGVVPEEKKEQEPLPDSSQGEDKPAPKEEMEKPEDEQLQIKVNALKQQEEILRKQIVELRSERRKERYGESEKPFIIPKEQKKQDDDLEDVADSDVSMIEKVLKSKGYIRREEVEQLSYKENLEKAKDEWLEEHKEYLPENDIDDQNWNGLNRILELYFKAPKNPFEIKKVMSLAHKMIKGDIIPIVNKAQIDSSKEKINISSKGGSGSGPAPSPKSANTKKIDTSYLKGFTEEELKEFNN